MELVENDTNNQSTFLGEEQLRHVKPGASTKYNELEQNELAAESHWFVRVSVISFCHKLNWMSFSQPVIQPVQFAYAPWSASTIVEWVSYLQSGVLGHISPGVMIQTKLSIFYVITTFVQKVFSKMFHFDCFIGSERSSKSKYSIQLCLPYHLSMRHADLAKRSNAV